MRLSPDRYAEGMQHRAQAVYASPQVEGVHAEGVIVSYTDAPTYVIVTDEGRTVPWRADLTEVGELVSDEEYHRHTNARRLRDGRPTVRPEFAAKEYPFITAGISVLELLEAVVASGLNPADVAVVHDDYNIHLAQFDYEIRIGDEWVDQRDTAKVRELRKAEEERAREAERVQAKLEATDADPLEGW
jgi:hypothetical protein